jgi:hypothetical protein
MPHQDSRRVRLENLTTKDQLQIFTDPAIRALEITPIVAGQKRFADKLLDSLQIIRGYDSFALANRSKTGEKGKAVTDEQLRMLGELDVVTFMELYTKGLLRQDNCGLLISNPQANFWVGGKQEPTSFYLATVQDVKDFLTLRMCPLATLYPDYSLAIPEKHTPEWNRFEYARQIAVAHSFNI